MWWKVLAVAAATVSPLWPQFADLATDRFGSRVVFSSALSLRSEERKDWPKIFEADGGGARSLVVREPEYDFPAPVQKEPAFFRLRAPELTSDGGTLGWLGERSCRFGCAAYETYSTSVRRIDGSSGGYFGKMRISANGLWGYNYGWTALGTPLVESIYEMKGTAAYAVGRRPSGTPHAGRRMVANDGTVVLASGESVLIARPGRPLAEATVGGGAAEAVVDDCGRFAVWESGGELPFIGVLDLYSLTSIVAVAAEEGCSLPALSEDGATLMFLSRANWEARNDGLRMQVWLMDLPTGVLRQVTSDAAGVAEATISGDGRVVFAVTLDGRLLRVDTGSLDAETWVAATPFAASAAEVQTSPGARFALTGRGLAAALIEINGVRASVYPLDGATVEVETAAATPTGAGFVEISGAASPFQPQRIRAQVSLSQ
jgi:hypothetical protein